MFFVYGEDLAAGLTGPFNTQKEAEEHIEFKRQRGDADVCYHNNARVVTVHDIRNDPKVQWAYANNLVSASKDRMTTYPNQFFQS